LASAGEGGDARGRVQLGLEVGAVQAELAYRLTVDLDETPQVLVLASQAPYRVSGSFAPAAGLGGQRAGDAVLRPEPEGRDEAGVVALEAEAGDRVSVRSCGGGGPGCERVGGARQRGGGGAIEAALAARHLSPEPNPARMALFDLSSSWLEGAHCPLAARGYSRDGKKGRLQIEYGLLTDPAGRPVAVRVLPGNTGDPAAFTPVVVDPPGPGELGEELEVEIGRAAGPGQP